VTCPRCLHPLPERGYTICANCGASFHWSRAKKIILTEHTDNLRPERLRLLVDGLLAARHYSQIRSI